MTRSSRTWHEENGRTVGLRLRGPLLAGARVEAVLRRVRRALAGGARVLTLDLGEVALIDGGGVGLLILCREEARRHGAALRVTRARGLVRTMLRLSAVLNPLQSGPGAPRAGRRHAGQDVPLLLPA